MVLLAYVDESYTKERYFIAAVLVEDHHARALTEALDLVVRQIAEDFGGVPFTAELHGHDLVAGRRDWTALAEKVRVRIRAYDRALQQIVEHGCRVMIRSVHTVGLDARYPNGHDHPHSIVLAHLIERIDEYAEHQDDRVLLIADEVGQHDTYRRDLWNYQRTSTWGYRARKITRVVDTIHFAPSHASRLLQCADLVAYLTRRRETHREADPRAARANQTLWETIEPAVIHNWCWWP